MSLFVPQEEEEEKGKRKAGRLTLAEPCRLPSTGEGGKGGKVLEDRERAKKKKSNKKCCSDADVMEVLCPFSKTVN